MQVQVSSQEKLHHLVVIGAGPAGLSAATFARNKNLTALIIEADTAGGQMTSLWPKKQVHNFPAFVETTAEEFAQKLIQQALSRGSVLHERETVKGIQRANQNDLLVATDKGAYRARSVIIATGLGEISPRELGLAREQEFVGKGLSYAVIDPSSFSGKRALVVGGGDSAVDNALLLSGFAAQVLIAHHSATFRAQSRSIDMLEEKGVVLLTSTRVIDILGDSALDGVRLLDTKTNQKTSLPLDALVVNIGLKPKLGPVAEWGLEMKGHFIAVDTEMRTSIEGIFACGDSVSYPGKVRLVVTAIGEAAVAVNSAAAQR
jgi:thioredoxin reductase